MAPTASYQYLSCPMCDVEVPMSGDERVGEDVYCPYCQTPLKLKKTKQDDYYLQENF